MKTLTLLIWTVIAVASVQAGYMTNCARGRPATLLPTSSECLVLNSENGQTTGSVCMILNHNGTATILFQTLNWMMTSIDLRLYGINTEPNEWCAHLDPMRTSWRKTVDLTSIPAFGDPCSSCDDNTGFYLSATVEVYREGEEDHMVHQNWTVIRKENWTVNERMDFVVYCGDMVVDGPSQHCRWVYTKDVSRQQCYTDAHGTTRGVINGPYTPGSYRLELWEGMSDCTTTTSTGLSRMGYLTLDYHSDSSGMIQARYHIESPLTLIYETRLYMGYYSSPVSYDGTTPLKQSQYPYTYSSSSGATIVAHYAIGFVGEVYMIGYAIVCNLS